jgi:hypothetical protein
MSTVNKYTNYLQLTDIEIIANSEICAETLEYLI